MTLLEFVGAAAVGALVSLPVTMVASHPNRQFSTPVKLTTSTVVVPVDSEQHAAQPMNSEEEAQKLMIRNHRLEALVAALERRSIRNMRVAQTGLK